MLEKSPTYSPVPANAATQWSDRRLSYGWITIVPLMVG
jgi:hypothetical protein